VRRNGVIASPDDFEHEGGLVCSVEGVLLGAHLVEHAAQGPDVGFLVVGLFLAEFGGEVERRAYDRAGEILGGQHLGHPEVA
jgi:hypothetical protein